MMNPNRARFLLRGIGFITVCFAMIGLWYNSSSFMRYHPGMFDAPELAGQAPYFRNAYFLVSLIYVACYLALLWSGVQLLRSNPGIFWLFTTMLFIEVLLFVLLGVAWRLPIYGPSIAAISGVAGGGFIPQVLLLYPVWAPLAVWWARKKLTTS
jgi:hypothetical protein